MEGDDPALSTKDQTSNSLPILLVKKYRGNRYAAAAIHKGNAQGDYVCLN